MTINGHECTNLLTFVNEIIFLALKVNFCKRVLIFFGNYTFIYVAVCVLKLPVECVLIDLFSNDG